MKNLLLKKALLLLCFFPVQLFAQDITGLWAGEMYVDSTKKYLPYEISISEVKGKLVGYSHIIFEDSGRLESGIRDITIKRKGDEVVIEDVSLIENSFSFVPPKNIKKTMVVTLTVNDTLMFLKGGWSTNKTRRYLSATGTVQMQRKSDYKATVLYKKLDSLKLASQLVFNEPQAPATTVAKIENVVLPEPLINPDAARKRKSANTKVAASSAAVAAVSKPVEIQKPIVEAEKPAPAIEKPAPVVATTAKPAEGKKTVAVAEKPAQATVAAAKPVEVKKPVAVTPKPAPAAPVAIAKPAEVKKTVAVEKPAPAKPTPAPVAKAAAVIEKPKEIAVAVPEKKAAPVVLPSVAQGAADINKRSISSTQEVFYATDSLVLTLYDNGYVDGDTVSVVMNGDVIFSKQGLSTKAVSKTIHIDKSTPDSLMLVMYAENLGSIPPNTGLLVVHDGEAVYDVRFSADLKTNAAIILKRKKRE